MREYIVDLFKITMDEPNPMKGTRAIIYEALAKQGFQFDASGELRWPWDRQTSLDGLIIRYRQWDKHEDPPLRQRPVYQGVPA